MYVLCTNNGFAWLELAGMLPKGRMRRYKFIRIDDKEALKSWRKDFANIDIYQSMCRFRFPKPKSSYICDFVMDIDAENLEAARADTLKIFDLLWDHLMIKPEYIDLAFSGCKGFHIVVPLEVFGEPNDPDMLNIWQHLAMRLSKEGIEHIDLNIYQPSRLLRMVNSINSKSGLYKVALDYKELRDWGIEYVLKVAKSPREYTSMAEPQECPKAVGWFKYEALPWLKKHKRDESSKNNYKSKFKDGWRIPPCIKQLQKTTLKDGFRHHTYFALARFYAWIGMHPQEIKERIQNIDEKNPIHDRDYISRIIKYCYKYPGFPGCDNPILKTYCNRKKCFRTKYEKAKI